MSELSVAPLGERRSDLPAGSFISVTSIHLEDPERRPEFSGQLGPINRQVKQEPPGLRAYKAYSDPEDRTTYYTVTAWDSEENMRRFLGEGAHGEAMENHKKSPLGTVNSAHWIGDTMPTLEEIKERLHQGRPV